jgi:hypothetical protein
MIDAVIVKQGTRPSRVPEKKGGFWMETRQTMELKEKDANRESEYPEMRFGIQAVERGFITSSDLREVISIQAMEKKYRGKHRFIGRILFDQGLLSISQIDEVLESMGKGPALGLK